MVDVDGVIAVHPDPRGWSANLERDLGLCPKRLHETFFVPHFDDVVHGRVGLHERLSSVLNEIAPHLTSHTLADYWFSQDSHLDHDLLNQLASVRSCGVELHLATVQEHERARYLWETVRLRERFDAIHYAAALGYAKPATEFFAKIENRTGFAPAELFFIDDRAVNVEAARRRGWRAAVWTGHQRLAELMREAGVTEFVPLADHFLANGR
jgi:putative hydrolase of the HAD superfamily